MRTPNYIFVRPGNQYKVKNWDRMEKEEYWLRVYFYDSNNNYLGNNATAISSPFTVSSGANYLKIRISHNDKVLESLITDLRLEKN